MISVQSLPLLTEFSNDFVRYFSIDATEGGSFGETISPNELEATPSSKFRKRKRSILDEIQLNFLCDLSPPVLCLIAAHFEQQE